MQVTMCQAFSIIVQLLNALHSDICNFTYIIYELNVMIDLQRDNTFCGLSRHYQCHWNPEGFSRRDSRARSPGSSTSSPMATRRRPAVSVDAPASEPGSVAAVELDIRGLR